LYATVCGDTEEDYIVPIEYLTPAGMKVVVVGVLALVGHQRLLRNSQGSGCSFSKTPDLSTCSWKARALHSYSANDQYRRRLILCHQSIKLANIISENESSDIDFDSRIIRFEVFIVHQLSPPNHLNAQKAYL
jgi:hypothetical protein